LRNPNGLTPEQRQIDRLLKRRAKVSRIRVALNQSLKDLTGFSADLKTVNERLDQFVKRMDAQVKALIEANQDRKQQYTRLRKIAGLGGVVVRSSVLNTLERVPLHSADAFIAFTGLDPRPEDSGHHIGRRRLSKRGPSELWRLLHIAAMAAVKTKLWKPIYEHYRTKGLSTTAALVVIARRIARTAWSVYTPKTDFEPKHGEGPSCSAKSARTGGVVCFPTWPKRKLPFQPPGAAQDFEMRARAHDQGAGVSGNAKAGSGQRPFSARIAPAQVIRGAV
jgi:transposase